MNTHKFIMPIMTAVAARTPSLASVSNSTFASNPHSEPLWGKENDMALPGNGRMASLPIVPDVTPASLCSSTKPMNPPEKPDVTPLAGEPIKDM